MITSAYEMGEQLGCRLYDALYLIVANALQAPFVTADRKLFDTIKDRLDDVVWIEDYAERIQGRQSEG